MAFCLHLWLGEAIFARKYRHLWLFACTCGLVKPFLLENIGIYGFLLALVAW